MNKITKWVLVVVFSMVILGSGLYVQFNQRKSEGVVSSDESFGWKYTTVKRFLQTGSGYLAYSSVRDSRGVVDGLPVRLMIPIIGVNSLIEDALITPEGRMDVPAGSKNVAWFALGPNPGQVGSAVIGGHFGIRGGVKFVFYDLDKLRLGDKIYIEDDRGSTLTFQVRSIKLFDRNADATTVFTSLDGLAHLNLITCEGVWNRVDDAYPERRVVFADAIKTENGVPTNIMSTGSTEIPITVTFSRSLSIGSHGADVTALQAFLEQKEFIKMPLGVEKGFFGTLTSIAVARYQTSAGLSPVGIFGPLTQQKVLIELAADTSLPDAGADDIPRPDDINSPSQSAESISQSLKSLYGTPRDGLITSLLLAGIVFLTLKIIRLRRD